jgi:hypothetical protein
MERPTAPLAAIMASTDGVPRIVRHSSAFFLVTPQGDVWRVFDSDDERGQSRYAPASDPKTRARVFVGSGAKPVVRLYLFQGEEARAMDADHLMSQMRGAEPIAT